MTAASWEFIPNTLKDWFVQTVRVDNQLRPVVLLSFENQNLNQFLHHHLTGDVTVDVSDFLKEKATMLTDLFQHPIPTRKQPYQCIMGGFAHLFRNTVFDRSQLGLFLALHADDRALSGKRCQTATRKCV